MKGVLAIVITTLALAFVTTAGADHYGTSRTQASQMSALVYKTFGGGWRGNCAVRIMYRESGGNPRASNWGDSNGGSFGLMQLNGAHRWRGESMAAFRARMWNPYSHLAAAKRLYNGSGFAPWGGCP